VSAQPTARRGPAFRVLVVDDEAAIRLLCRVNLEASGMEVVEASDGLAGLAAAEEHRPDVVLLDVMMPALNGWDVARELSERGSTTPIIFLTALADQSARVKAYEHGGVGYILKPFDPVALARYVEAAVDRIERGERDDLRRGILEGGGEA
jgi:two-component system, OmpR family, response regulator